MKQNTKWFKLKQGKIAHFLNKKKIFLTNNYLNLIFIQEKGFTTFFYRWINNTYLRW